MKENETLLDRALINYNVARTVYQVMTDDETYLNVVGYHLQQALELALKYTLEENGVEYPKTHSIETLIRLGRENDIDLYIPEYIDDHSEMFSAWESQTRYVLNYTLEARKVTAAINSVCDYLCELKNHEFLIENEIPQEYTPDDDLVQ